MNPAGHFLILSMMGRQKWTTSSCFNDRSTVSTMATATMAYHSGTWSVDSNGSKTLNRLTVQMPPDGRFESGAIVELLEI